jgi:hypothetical protein
MIDQNLLQTFIEARIFLAVARGTERHSSDE